jgi:hypothetical protein
MKIKIFKKDNDTDVYYKDEQEIEFKLNFDQIKIIAKKIIELKISGQSFDYEIEVKTPDLELYKTTLENVIKSVTDDEELIKIYNSSKDEIIIDESNVNNNQDN